MLERQKRLNEVYDYLHSNKGIHTKAGFADAIKYARAYVSSALNGNEKYLTDKLFRSICGKGDYRSSGVVLWSEYPDGRTDRTAQHAERDCRACKLSWNDGRTDDEHLRIECRR